MLKANIAGLGEVRSSDFGFRMGFEFEFGWDIEPKKYWNICTYYICVYNIYIIIYNIICVYILYTSERSQSGIERSQSGIQQRYEKGYRTMKIYWIYGFTFFLYFDIAALEHCICF